MRRILAIGFATAGMLVLSPANGVTRQGICSVLVVEPGSFAEYPPDNCSGQVFGQANYVYVSWNLFGRLSCPSGPQVDYGDQNVAIQLFGQCPDCWPFVQYTHVYDLPNGDHGFFAEGYDQEIRVEGQIYWCVEGNYRLTGTNPSIYSRTCDDPDCSNPCAGGCPSVPDCGSGEEIFYDECGCRNCNPTPVLVQLDGGPMRFSDPSAGALFDIYNTGRKMRLSWPVSAGTAFLALDRNGDGVISSGAELFGNTRRLAFGEPARNGYEVLGELDSNADGVIDARDPAFSDLLLWEDVNHDGASEPSELIGLPDAGIIALGLDVRESLRRDQWGNSFRYRAKVHAASAPIRRFSFDVVLVVDRTGGAASACAAAGR